MGNTTGQTWWLPGPIKGPDGQIEWYPVVRVGRLVPFGYKEDPNDKDILLPIPEELELLEKAKLYLKEYSLRQVANWLSEESGRYISHVGLSKRVDLENRRKYGTHNARTYARKYKEAAEKAQKLERRIGGRKASNIPDGHIFKPDFFQGFDDEDYDPNYFTSKSNATED